MPTGEVFFGRRTRKPAGFWTRIGQAQFDGDNGQLGRAGRIALEHDVPNTRIPKARKQIRSFGRDHDEPFGLLFARRKAVELTFMDHYNSIDPQVRLVNQVNPVSAITQQGSTQGLCEFRIPNGELNGFHINP